MAAELLYGVVELYRFDEYNNTYSSCCVLVYRNSKTVKIKGLSSKITKKDWIDLYKYLQSKGVTKAIYERRKEGKTLDKVINVKPIQNLP